MKALQVIFLLTLITCDNSSSKIHLKLVDHELLMSKHLRPQTDTIWADKNQNRLIIGKTSREQNVNFLIEGDNVYLIILREKEKVWKFKGDSIVVYNKWGIPHWSRFEGDYNGFWSEINPTYSRSMYPFEQPDSVQELPTRPGIYLLSETEGLVEVKNTNKEGIYYFSEFYKGIDEILTVDELLTRKF